MRELAKSLFTFPWAMSMLAVQQIANLAAPSPEGRVARAKTSLDAVSSATEDQLDGWAKQTYQVGNGVQRGVVDLMMLRPPAIDSSSLMRMAAEMQSSAIFQAAMKYGMPPVGWVDSKRVSRADQPAVLQEFENKLHIIQLVTQVHSQLGLEGGADQPIAALVERTMTMETFPRLWAVEGLGNYYGDKALERAAVTGVDPEGVLTDAAGPLPPWSLTMLHAGIGMSNAKAVLAGLTTASPPETVRSAILRFTTLCRKSSRPGYAGAALESLGLATRTLYPNLVSLIDQELPAVAPEIRGYFWHGAGRAMYFSPMNMLPSSNAPWGLIAALDHETPDALAYRDALAGIAWALTVVNMRHPIVMETFLRHHGALAVEHDAFENGLTSSLMMRYDTSRDDAYIGPFLHHEPAGDAAAVSAWRRLVREPGERALHATYGELQRAGALEELFHYRPRPA